MERNRARFTVYFEDPFWVGIYEREEDGRYSACKITFGAEPRDNEVYAYLLQHGRDLRFSPSLPSRAPEERRINPKRMQRSIQGQIQQGVGTKAQQALKLQQEQRGAERKAVSRQKREEEKERRFALRQEKRKARHRGH